MKVTDPDAIQIMKDYMANGRFSRGVTQVHADASIVFIGNLNQPVEMLVANAGTDLFQPLPREFDLAVIDRIHFYLPGWEIPKNSKAILTDHYGFVTDYAAEAFRALRKQNRIDALEGRFRLGSHVEGRDAAVKRTVSGLLKLLPRRRAHKGRTPDVPQAGDGGSPSGQGAAQEARGLRVPPDDLHLDRPEEGRRRRGGPGAGWQGRISPDPLPPGTVYAAFERQESRVGLMRLEVAVASGMGKVRTPSGMRGHEGVAAARLVAAPVKERQGWGCSSARRTSPSRPWTSRAAARTATAASASTWRWCRPSRTATWMPGTVVLGDVSMQGNIKPLPSIIEPLQVALDNGALRALVPIANKSQVAGLPEEVVEKLDLVFYGDPDRAPRRALAN